MEKECGIYIYRNRINGKVYVGKSNDLYKRHQDHMRYLMAGTDPCIKLNRAWQKYGADNFEYEVVCYCAEDELNEKEKYYVSLYNSLNDGYNCTAGGDGITGYRHTEEAKRRIAAAGMGRPASQRMIDVARERFLGKKFTEEHKHALRDAWTPERKQKMTETRSGKDNPNYGKTGWDATKITPVTCQTGEVFPTVHLAAEWCGQRSLSNISMCINGQRPFSGRHPVTGEKLVWRRATQEEIDRARAEDLQQAV